MGAIYTRASLKRPQRLNLLTTESDLNVHFQLETLSGTNNHNERSVLPVNHADNKTVVEGEVHGVGCVELCDRSRDPRTSGECGCARPGWTIRPSVVALEVAQTNVTQTDVAEKNHGRWITECPDAFG